MNMKACNHYKHLHERIFTEASSNQFKKISQNSSSNTPYGDFMLQGRIHFLPISPVPKQVALNMFYVQHYAIIEMNQYFFTKRKNYASFLILYTLEGEGELIYQGHSYTLSPGDGFFINCMSEHTYRSLGDKWYHAVLHINGGNMAYYYTAFFSQRSPVFHFNPVNLFQSKLEKIIDLQCSVLRDRDLHIDTALHEILETITNHPKEEASDCKTSETIQYLCRYMENHFTEQLTLESLANFCGLNQSYLCRVFKRQTSYSPKEYITLLRLEQAKLLLRDTDIAAYKIDILVGIPNEANFIRLFKKYESVSPGEYRARLSVSSEISDL